MTRRYRIQCEGERHAVDLDDDGQLHFRAHPGAFSEVDTTRAFAVLCGDAAPEGNGCLRVALLVRRGALVGTVPGGDDTRRLLAALRGIRIARRLRRKTQPVRSKEQR